MTSASLIPFLSYSDSCRQFQITRDCQIGYENRNVFPIPAPSFLSRQQRKRTGCLRVTPRPTIVSARFSKSANVTWKSWDKLVLKNESPVLVEFHASWCGPCQMVHRVIDEIATEYRGKLECFVLNTDDEMLLAEEYDIKAVPVVLLFKNGEKHNCIAGTMPKEFYVAAIEKLLVS